MRHIGQNIPAFLKLILSMTSGIVENLLVDKNFYT
jgi:hypothetical protein